MYTLSKAKSEIDLVAKHATDIAGHLIAMGGTIDGKLEAFKADLLSAIDAKFVEFSRTIHGEEEAGDTSAIQDLGTQVSRLTQGTPAGVDGVDASSEGHVPPEHETLDQGHHDTHDSGSEHHESHGEPHHDHHGN